jgi:hypothetical protein
VLSSLPAKWPGFDFTKSPGHASFLAPIPTRRGRLCQRLDKQGHGFSGGSVSARTVGEIQRLAPLTLAIDLRSSYCRKRHSITMIVCCAVHTLDDRPATWDPIICPIHPVLRKIKCSRVFLSLSLSLKFFFCGLEKSPRWTRWQQETTRVAHQTLRNWFKDCSS